MRELNGRQLLQQRLSRLNSAYYSRVQAGENSSDSQSVLSGICTGYDADSSSVLVTLPGGNTISARLITSGAIAIGTQMQIFITKGSSIAHADEMPS
ncbi:hypothetical protein H6G00_00755 [Leptolyngbya sp. FACHB-541]|uniref:hypothetical protein n=1 Tax=Leptolyngbya sp. FACHB-541 TaxID=2692810 RepID=UPI0016841F8E|nr:hypothetical protein [Leptolyngbya sp. FACHB-541]MBD1995157.1 hypothetical protein [Leptolyngbya sp. FACHB-541]